MVINGCQTDSCNWKVFLNDSVIDIERNKDRNKTLSNVIEGS